MVGAPMRCEGFMAIWLRAREDIAANRFQLLFMNMDTSIYIDLAVGVDIILSC